MDIKRKMEIKIKKQIWNASPNGLKCRMRSNLLKYKVNLDNFEEDYKRHLSIINCESCYCLLTRDKYTKSTTKQFDHNHITSYYRNTICSKCNLYRGLVDKRYKLVLNEFKFIFNLPKIFKVAEKRLS
tara:strand:- start:244 stop:627 length:384 start_codon:yes stop_codon:yes gene_type:complete